jgi:5-methyltetrahydrofolate--homocysteine methyltransferase
MIVIGEKLNGFIPSVGKAIREHDEAYLTNLAIRQEEAGADYLDVCAAVDSEIEAETLLWLSQLAENASIPACSGIDSPIRGAARMFQPHCNARVTVN